MQRLLTEVKWDCKGAWAEYRRQMLAKTSDPQGILLVDDTAFPKKGRHSVGVARQYCGALGKVANCQVAVTLHWSSAEASCPLGWRLYLPRAWLEDQARAREVKLPEGLVYRSQTELALELIDQMVSWEVPGLPVVGGSAYGNSFAVRAQLRPRGRCCEV